MRRLLHKLALALLFCLSFAPVALIGGWSLLGSLPAAFTLLALDVPVAFLLSLVPGYVGGRIRHAEPAQPTVHRFETESESRFLAEDAQRRKKPLRAPLCALCMAGLTLGTALLPIPALAGAGLVMRVLQGLLSAILIPFALMLVLDEQNRVSTTCATGFAIYLAASVYLAFEKNPALTRAMYALGLAFLTVAALFLNEQALTNGAASRRSGRPSARLLRRNRVILLCFAALGAVILYFDRIRQAASTAAKAALAWLWEAFAWLTNLFLGGESGGSGGGGGGDLSGLMEGGETGAFWKYTEKFLIALAFILAAAALVWLGVRVYRLIRKGVLRLLEKLRGVTRSLGEDYVDEQESLDWGEMSRGVKDELKKRLERLTRREKKWTEMDAREKVRYVVRRMYKRAGGGLSSLTIREAASQLPRGSASEEEVASLYEQARYAETAPTQEQAERLRRDVKP